MEKSGPETRFPKKPKAKPAGQRQIQTHKVTERKNAGRDQGESQTDGGGGRHCSADLNIRAQEDPREVQNHGGNLCNRSLENRERRKMRRGESQSKVNLPTRTGCEGGVRRRDRGTLQEFKSKTEGLSLGRERALGGMVEFSVCKSRGDDRGVESRKKKLLGEDTSFGEERVQNLGEYRESEKKSRSQKAAH